MNKKLFVSLAVMLVLIQLALFTWFAANRNIDQDEGFYTIAFRLALEGKRPGVDFLFGSAMPLFPYTYGYWLKIFDLSHTLFNVRLLSVISSVILSILLFYFIYDLTKDKKITLVALFLYTFNAMLLIWHTTVKTYAMSSLFLFASFILLTKINKNAELIKLFFCGLFLSVAVNIRPIFFPMLLVYFLHILIYNKKNIFKKIIIYLTGILIPSILSVYFFIKNPAMFYFSQVGKDAVRLSLDMPTITSVVIQKYRAVYVLVTDPQYLMLLIFSLAAFLFFIKKWKNKTEFLVYAILAIISLSYLIATWVFVQYFVQTVPFLLVLSALFFKRIRLSNKAIFPFLAFYLLIGTPFAAYVYIAKISGIDKDWDIRDINQVAAEIQQLPGKNLLAWWPGYSFLTDKELFPGLENGVFGHTVLAVLPEEKARQYKIQTRTETFGIIINKKADIVIVDRSTPPEFLDLIKTYYRPYKEVGLTQIYIKSNT